MGKPTLTERVLKHAKTLYPDNKEQRDAYVKGFFDSSQNVLDTPSEVFLTELASKLREMWPAGDKEGKWAWRDSVPNLKDRLTFVWKERKLGQDYTMDMCLAAARRYLAQYEDNAKYMMVLKYFIFKQDKIVGHNGKITYTYKSKFADMLTDASLLENQEEWQGMFNETMMQGELV